MRISDYAVAICWEWCSPSIWPWIGKVGSTLGNPRVANAVAWCIGATAAVIIGATGWRAGALSGVRDVHSALFTAGALGACLVFAIAWMVPPVRRRERSS